MKTKKEPAGGVGTLNQILKLRMMSTRCTSKANILMLGFYSKKNLKWYCQIKKKHGFVKKNTKNYLKNPPKWSWGTTPRFLRRKEKKAYVCFFCQNLVYTSENYSYFNNVLLSIESSLEINDFYRTRGNVSFTELPEIINTLTNQDFPGLYKFNELGNFFCLQVVTRKLNYKVFKKIVEKRSINILKFPRTSLNF